MATKRNRRTQMTIKLLHNSFLELLQEKDYSEITIKELCSRADLNRTTFYLHYPHLDALYAEIENDAENHIMDYIKSIRHEDDKVEYINRLLHYVQQNPTVFKILLLSDSRHEAQTKLFTQVLNFVNEKSLSGVSPKQSRYAKDYITHGCLGVVNAWIDNDFNLQSDILAKQIFDMCAAASSAVAK